MNIKKTLFEAGDLVFASLVQGGREIAAMRFTGVGSIADIVSYVRRVVSDATGLVTMRIRNFNQGWTVNHTILLGPQLA